MVESTPLPRSTTLTIMYVGKLDVQGVGCSSHVMIGETKFFFAPLAVESCKAKRA